MSRKGGKGRPSNRAAQSNVRLRIIGGALRRRQIQAPAIADLRPTPDRVRETLFNWLQADMEGALCLDLFAGSGVLAFEALSRGAARVVAVEQDAALAASIRAHAVEFGCDGIEVVCDDAWRWLEHSSQRFDLVFLDPPFREGALARALALLADGHCLAEKALIYLESEASGAAPELPPGWQMLRCDKAGQVRYHLAVTA